MKRFAPRTFVHLGAVEAEGFVLDEALVGERRLRERALGLWQPGASVRRLDGGRWWLGLGSPRRVACAQAPGAPLVREGGVLCAAPGLGAEARSQGAAEGSLALLEGGSLRVFGPDAGEPLDPASWLDLGSFGVGEVAGPPAAVVEARTALPAAAASVRQALGVRLAPPPPEAAEVARALHAPRPASAPREPLAPPLLVRWLAGLYRGLASLMTRLAVARQPTVRPAALPPAGAPRGLVVRKVDPSGPGLAQRLMSRLNDLAARLLLASRMASFIGKKQAEYLGRMMDMFERGDLDEALRHAIPLGADDPGGERGAYTLAAPSPRSDLAIQVGSGSPGSSVLPFAGLHEELKRLYRTAFERLDAQGRVEEAAFVLAELLRDTAEAVAYLERHGRLRLAAELAEGRGLPPGLAVRLWFLAGEAERALLLARRHGAFEDAIVRLEKSDPERAKALRLLWANVAALGGDYLRAERILDGVDEGRTLRLGWLSRAAALGGPAAMAAWPRLLALAPERFDEATRALGPLLDDPDPSSSRDRLALADSIALAARSQPAAPLLALARPLLRSLLRDAGADAEPREVGLLRDLLADPVLRQDWPAAPPTPPGQPLAPLKVRIPAASVGVSRTADAVVLPGGRFLVALGELGVALLARDGRRLVHFDQPADSLVVSTHGDRALALSPRGRVTRVARIDLAGQRSEPWCEAELSAWMPDFDGSSWLVGSRGALLSIDALSPGWTSLWRFATGASVVALGHTGEHVGALTMDRGRSLALLRFDPASLALRHRDALAPPPPGFERDLEADAMLRELSQKLGRLPPEPDPEPPAAALLVRDGGALQWEKEGNFSLLEPGKPPTRLELWWPQPGPVQLHAHGQRVLLSLGDRAQGYLLRGAAPDLVLEVLLQDAARVVVHPSQHGYAVADDRGRLLHVDPASLALVRSLRV